MPCESCHVQFSVFKRKRSCIDCKRFYCSNCLLKNQHSHLSLCERCTIFAKRPLLRADLLSLKPKDLIFYLQSKHISTAGCVEKDELVGLVLNHVQQNDTSSPNHLYGNYQSSTPFNSDDTTNSFDTLKQSCQNFFSNISDNISESLASFDSKNKRKSSTTNQTHLPQDQAQPNVSYVSEQPRVSTREIPRYASSQNHDNRSGNFGFGATQNYPNTKSVSTSVIIDQQEGPTNCVDSTNTVIADMPCTSNTTLNNQMNNIQANNTSGCLDLPTTKSDCDCSDDEFLVNLHELLSFKNNLQYRNLAPKRNGASISTTSTHVNICEIDGNANNDNINNDDDDDADSSHSSFEELGAIGGISDESKAATDTNSSILEQWQILDNQRLENVAEANNVSVGKIKNNVHINKPHSLKKSLNEQFNSPKLSTRKVKKVSRRRSDGYLNQRLTHSDEDSSPVSADGVIAEINLETSDAAASTSDNIKAKQHCSNCKRCGKNKTSIRRHVEKMRKHLESSEMSEENIKHELEQFLAYLESRTKSIDLSDSDGIIETSETIATTTLANSGMNTTTEYYGEDDGIHVYAASAAKEAASRFINLDDFDTTEDLETLTVKQLKEVLMLHRVDYKGCCEKQELLDRVERLWKNLKTAPATEKLPTDELCKICMDAPIECVILECGHMATCTNCGKVLSECPICRQYIVRVVRFFRA